MKVFNNVTASYNEVSLATNVVTCSGFSGYSSHMQCYFWGLYLLAQLPVKSSPSLLRLQFHWCHFWRHFVYLRVSTTLYCLLYPYRAYPVSSGVPASPLWETLLGHCWKFDEQYLALTWGHRPLHSTVDISNTVVWWTHGRSNATHICSQPATYIHT